MPVTALLAIAITAALVQALVIDLVKDPPKHDLNRVVHYHFGGTHPFGTPQPPPRSGLVTSSYEARRIN